MRDTGESVWVGLIIACYHDTRNMSGESLFDFIQGKRYTGEDSIKREVCKERNTEDSNMRNQKGSRRLLIRLAMTVLLAAGIMGLSVAMGEGGCDHQWTVHSSVPPTCTEDGETVERCGLCGAERTMTVPALGHEWGMCTIVTKPDCRQEGLIRCICNRDASHHDDKILPALGHEWGEYVTIVPATCRENGIACRTCARDSSHQEETSLPALGHDWGDWYTAKKATATEEGISERKCQRCGSTQQYPIPALGPGLFSVLAGIEGADERLAQLEEIAERIDAKWHRGQTSIEIDQVWFEGDRIFISYRMSGERMPIREGLELVAGIRVEKIAGTETETENGDLIGWMECVVPEERIADAVTFQLVFGKSNENRLSFTTERCDKGLDK